MYSERSISVIEKNKPWQISHSFIWLMEKEHRERKKKKWKEERKKLKAKPIIEQFGKRSNKIKRQHIQRKYLYIFVIMLKRKKKWI